MFEGGITSPLGGWFDSLYSVSMRGSLLIAIAFILMFALRRRSAAVRSFVWHLTLAAVLAMPVLTFALSRLPVDAPLRTPVSLPIVDQVASFLERPALPAWAASPNANENRSAADAPSSEVPRTLDWRVVVVLVWLTGGVMATVPLLIAWRRLSSLERGARRITDPRLLSLVARSADQSGITARVTVLESSVQLIPMIWGLWRPRLLVPDQWVHWSDLTLATVVQHELAHVRRRDLAARWICDVSRVIFWHNPLVWLASREAHLAREQACDDEVLAQGIAATAYADALVGLVRSLRGTVPSTRSALAVVSRHAFARRIDSLVDASRARHRLTRRTASGTATIATLMAVAFAAIAPAPELRAAPAADRSEIVREGMGRSLDSALIRLQLSGTVLVAIDGDVVLARGYGFADRARQVPNDIGTRFQVAGVLKAFTAAAIVDLADRGSIAVDAPVGRYLPELRGRASRITIEQLLTHTDGLSDVAPQSDPSSFVDALASATPAFAAGRSYQSLDVGHSLLALVIERVTATPFEQYVRDRFLGPGGMMQSYLRGESDVGVGSVAVGYSGNTGQPIVAPARDEWGVRGSRGLVTTVGDLYAWHSALLAGRLVRRDKVASLFTPRIRVQKGFDQGYGFLVYDSTSIAPFRGGQLPLWRRSGREPGFSAELVHDRDQGLTVIALFNSDGMLRLRALNAIRSVVAAYRAPP